MNLGSFVNFFTQFKSIPPHLSLCQWWLDSNPQPGDHEVSVVRLCSVHWLIKNQLFLAIYCLPFVSSSWIQTYKHKMVDKFFCQCATSLNKLKIILCFKLFLLFSIYWYNWIQTFELRIIRQFFHPCVFFGGQFKGIPPHISLCQWWLDSNPQPGDHEVSVVPLCSVLWLIERNSFWLFTQLDSLNL